MSGRGPTVAIVVASMVLASCAVAPAPPPTPPPTVAPSPTPGIVPTGPPTAPTGSSAPTPAPTAPPSPTQAVSFGPSPSASSMLDLPHADPALEGFLPASLSGISLTRLSSPGSVFGGGSDMCILVCGDEPYRYAKELGVGIDDVTVAFAVDDRLAIGMIAYRAVGAAIDDLIPARIAIGGYTGHTRMPPRPVRVAGRPATYLDAGFMTNGEYLMTRHGVLFIVLGEAPSDDGEVPDDVTEALGGVP